VAETRTGGLAIVREYDGKRVNPMTWLNKRNRRSFAEAHLIGAAPEMLRVLKMARAHITDPRMMAEIDGVIAKADQKLLVSPVHVPSQQWKEEQRAHAEHQEYVTMVARYGSEEEVEALDAYRRQEDEREIKEMEARERVKQAKQEMERTALAARKANGKRSDITAVQGQYLAYIHTYAVMHGQAPSRNELEAHFRRPWKAVNRMLRKLKVKGLIRYQHRTARSLEVLVDPKFLPCLQ
jgi:hypothetical protein